MAAAGRASRNARRGAVVLALTIVLAACADATASPSTPTFPADPDSARLHAEAQADLARWAAAVAGGQRAMGFVPIGSLTGQSADWEPAVAANNKIALQTGTVEPAVPMPSDQPPDGQVRWPDGTATSVALVSAAVALDEIRADAAHRCDSCQPLRVTGARLTDLPFETSRGTATVPTWTFSIEGSAVQITRVAVASRVTPIEPSIDPYDPPIGISIEQAWLAPDGRLSVGFTGGCNEDDRAEAVESNLAVVVIIHVVHVGPECARLIGKSYTVTVDLARPLADRAVLEVRTGQPVPVTHFAPPH